MQVDAEKSNEKENSSDSAQALKIVLDKLQQVLSLALISHITLMLPLHYPQFESRLDDARVFGGNAPATPISRAASNSSPTPRASAPSRSLSGQ
jgi:hypothetical protein